MKKFILLAVVSCTFIMCKKSDIAQSKLEEAVHAADSAVAVASNTVDEVSNTANKVLDSANIKIKEFENTKEDIREKIETTSKSIDSLAEKISSTKLESKPEKKDSTDPKPEKIVVNVPAPKVIKETKVVYKDLPKKDDYELSTAKNRMVKTGHISINAENAETVKEIIREEAEKNNAYITSEELSYVASEPVKNGSDAETSQKIYYMQIKVPIQNFDDLVNDLSSNLGDIESKNIDVSGSNYINNTICKLTVTLTDKSEAEKEPKTFGEKSFAAISSGWGVITSIFLFLLPFWPLFLITGIGYYFYKKKNTQRPSNGNDQNT
ncbi:hypothetical protein HNP38_000287 [Chryseobacterium defluvii]|uniref:DUF4349 domain-containing protein n=1 Tax=Chryseobacterium defluvii TaxID=160396 RepID=A0A840K9C8_9FLAO|nr:DUF4349 domain-containing protein [Chryseobacterium defluvii]MBB4805015.1 hypothetical protein [Chryseobacterium defluvii]